MAVTGGWPLRLVAWLERAGLLRFVDFAAAFLQMAGWPSRWRLLRLKLDRRLPPRLRLPRRPIPLRVRALAGAEYWVRPGSTDAQMLIYDYAWGQHVIPTELASGSLGAIVEIGCNAGAALLSYALEHPTARVLGVDADHGNVAQARANVARFGDRCRVVQSAVWSERCELVIDGADEYSLRARPARAADSATLPRLAAVSLDELLDEHMPEVEIDFLSLSIQGGEPDALAGAPRWPARVRAIRAELQPHAGFGREEAAARLRELGYEPRLAPLWLGGCMLGLRTPA